MRFFIKPFSLATALAFAFVSQAATWTWTGASSNSWDTKANWNTVSSQSRPQTGDVVIINPGASNQPRLVANRTIKSLIFNGGTLNLRDYNLTVNDTIYLFGGVFDNTSGGASTLISDYAVLNSNTPSSIIGSSDVITFTINNKMIFINGVLRTDANNLLIIADNATVTGASNNSYVDGPVRKAGNDAFSFPVGNSGILGEIGISDFSNNSTAQYHTAQYFYSAPSGTLSGGGRISQREYWSMQRSATNRTTRLTLSYNQHQRSGRIIDSTDLRVAVNDGTIWNPLATSISGNKQLGTLTTTSRVSGTMQGITISSPLGLNPLPVKLVDYQVIGSNNQALIKWKTTSEINNSHFTIEKSIDGTQWVKLAQINGQNTVSTINEYEYLDANTMKGNQYYRLTQTDLNGKTESFSVLAFAGEGNINLNLFPNPAHNQINLNSDSDQEVEAVILNSQGQTILTFSFTGIHTLSVEEFENGIYTLVINQSQTIRFVKN